MSKPFTHYARPHLTVASPGTLIKYIVRMGVYWLCATILLWPNQYQLTAWRPSTLLMFFIVSSVVVPALGYASFWLRGPENATTSPISAKLPHSFTHTLAQTALIGLELFLILMAAVGVEHLLL
jgi:hypothetical protein